MILPPVDPQSTRRLAASRIRGNENFW